MVVRLSDIDNRQPLGGCTAARQREARTAERAAVAAGPKGPLGKSTKYSDTVVREFATLDPETGVVTGVEQVQIRDGSLTLREKYDPDAADLERWILKQAARRRLMILEHRQKRTKVEYCELHEVCTGGYRRLVPTGKIRFHIEDVPETKKKAAVYRVANCSRSRILSSAPEVWQSRESGRCSLHGVQVCGSVWTCPTCSYKINRKRRTHLRGAYDVFLGGHTHERDAMLVTLTTRHGIGDDLGDLYAKLKKARDLVRTSYMGKCYSGYKNGRKRKSGYVSTEYPSLYDVVGWVSATEVKYGLKNGWHPHIHELHFFDRRLTDEEIETIRSDFFKAWKEACEAVGLDAPLEFKREKINGRWVQTKKPLGVDVRRALSAEEYLTKFGHERQRWGVENEMANTHAKTKSHISFTPFQLLEMYARGDTLSPLMPSKKAGDLFAVYAEVTLGRHQLEWSKSLKKRLKEEGLQEVLDESDEALANAVEEDSSRLGELTDDDFEALLSGEKLGVETFGLFLNLCKQHGFDSAVSWLRSSNFYPGHALRQAEQELKESATRLERRQHALLPELVFTSDWVDCGPGGKFKPLPS